MGRNNGDFENGRGSIEEEVDENAFNRSYEAWKKAGDPFYNKEKRKDNNE
jgi:hypothetical protein